MIICGREQDLPPSNPGPDDLCKYTEYEGTLQPQGGLQWPRLLGAIQGSRNAVHNTPRQVWCERGPW